MCGKAEDDISEIKSDLEACRMNVSVLHKGQKMQKENHEALQAQVDALKVQVDAFYKHYCENQSEGTAPPPVMAAPVAVAAAPSVDYSGDIASLQDQ